MKFAALLSIAVTLSTSMAQPFSSRFTSSKVDCDIGIYPVTKNIAKLAKDASDGPWERFIPIEGGAYSKSGPATCSQISCADGISINFCNDSEHPIAVDWDTIARTTNEIGISCGHGVIGKDGNLAADMEVETNGQKSVSDSVWNILVQAAAC